MLLSTEAFAQEQDLRRCLQPGPAQPDGEFRIFATSITTLLGVFRFPEEADFPLNGIQIDGGQALLSDARVGLMIRISNAEDQETWDWKFFNPDGRLVIVQRLFFFEDGAALGLPGRRNCFIFAGELFATCGSNSLSFAIVALRTRCKELGRFEINLEHTRPDGFTELLFIETFTVISAGPQSDVRLSPNLINPQVIGPPGVPDLLQGRTTVTVTVTDSGCTNIPLEGASVELSSKTVPGSGGHTHLGEQEGTGIFTLDRQSGKTVSGVSDRDGVVEATYMAGQVGLEENILATATFGT